MTPSSPKRICFFSVASHLGGAERSLADLVTRLESHSHGRYIPWLLLPKPEGALVDLLKKSDVRFDVLPMPPSLLSLSRGSLSTALLKSLSHLNELRTYLHDLSETISSGDAALVHTTGIKCQIFSAWIGRATQVPTLWHLRDIQASGPAYWALRALYARGGVQLVANSGATAEAFLPGSVKSGKAVVLYNGLDAAHWNPSGARRDTLTKSDNRPVIGIVGILTRWKGQLNFVRMAKILRDQGIEAQYKIIGSRIYDTRGDIGYEQELHAEIKRLHMEDCIELVGYVSDPLETYGSLDILVHASIKPEPFGRVLIEAMAVETPVVASAAGGVLEIIEDNASGILFPPDNVNKMAAAVKRIIMDPSLRQRIIHQARAAFLERFTIDRHVQKAIQIYDDYFKENRSGRSVELQG